jgi:hypothetical protein
MPYNARISSEITRLSPADTDIMFESVYDAILAAQAARDMIEGGY